MYLIKCGDKVIIFTCKYLSNMKCLRLKVTSGSKYACNIRFDYVTRLLYAYRGHDCAVDIPRMSSTL